MGRVAFEEHPGKGAAVFAGLSVCSDRGATYVFCATQTSFGKVQ